MTFVDPAHFLSDLYPSLSGLCSDPEVSVRRSAAAGFHQVRITCLPCLLAVSCHFNSQCCPFCQVVKLLGSNVHVVHKELLLLLQDNALEVRGHAHAACDVTGSTMFQNKSLACPHTRTRALIGLTDRMVIFWNIRTFTRHQKVLSPESSQNQATECW